MLSVKSPRLDSLSVSGLLQSSFNRTLLLFCRPDFVLSSVLLFSHKNWLRKKKKKKGGFKKIQHNKDETDRFKEDLINHVSIMTGMSREGLHRKIFSSRALQTPLTAAEGKKKSRLTMCFKIHVGKKNMYSYLLFMATKSHTPSNLHIFLWKICEFQLAPLDRTVSPYICHSTSVYKYVDSTITKWRFFFFFKRVNCFCKKHICRDELFSFSSWHMLMYQVYQVHVTYGFIS